MDDAEDYAEDYAEDDDDSGEDPMSIVLFLVYGWPALQLIVELAKWIGIG